MKIPHTMTSLSEAMNIMKSKGYNTDFEMTSKGFINQDTEKEYQPEDLVIKKIFRFEGESNPSDMAALYVIEAASGEKGLFVDAYGTYASQDAKNLSDFLKKIKVDEES